MKNYFKLLSNELCKLVCSRGILAVLAALVLFSALFSVFCHEHQKPVSSSWEDSFDLEYISCKVDLERFDLEQLSPSQQQAVQVARQVWEEYVQAVREFKVPPFYPLTGNDMQFTLNSYYSDKLSYELLDLGLISNEEEVQKIQECIYSLSPYYPFYFNTEIAAVEEMDRKFYEQKTAEIARLPKPVDLKEMADRNVELTKKNLKDAEETGEQEYVESVSGMLERAQLARKIGAYDPDHWAYFLLYNDELMSIQMELEEPEEPAELYRPLKGDYVDPATGRLENNIELLPWEKYKPLYDRLNAEKERDIEELSYGLRHNIRPIGNQYVADQDDPKLFVLQLLPLLLLAAAVSGAAASLSVGREYTGRTLGGLVSRPVSKDKLLLAKLGACAAFSGLSILLCGAAIFTASCVLYGPGELFSGYLLRSGKYVFHLPFLLVYIGKLAVCWCVALFASAAGCLLSLVVRRGWAGALAGAAVPAAVGMLAFLPGYQQQYTLYQGAKQRAEMMIDGPEVAQIDWIQAFRGMWEHLACIQTAAAALLLAAAAAAAAVFLFRRQDIGQS